MDADYCPPHWTFTLDRWRHRAGSDHAIRMVDLRRNPVSDHCQARLAVASERLDHYVPMPSEELRQFW